MSMLRETYECLFSGSVDILFCQNRQILASAYSSKGIDTWTYRYNQPDPTSGSPNIVAHTAENWMMFLGSNTGYVNPLSLTPLELTWG